MVPYESLGIGSASEGQMWNKNHVVRHGLDASSHFPPLLVMGTFLAVARRVDMTMRQYRVTTPVNHEAIMCSS